MRGNAARVTKSIVGGLPDSHWVAAGSRAIPETTLERVAGGTLSVGLSEQDSLVVLGEDGPVGVEVEIVRRFAQCPA